MFWKQGPEEGAGAAPPAAAAGLGYAVPVAVVASLAAITVAIGFGAELLFDLAAEASEQLLRPAGYIEAVLGGSL